MGEAARWTAFWVFLAALFAGVVYVTRGQQRALEFVTAYLLEESLSVDNMFVFVFIFQFFSQFKFLFLSYVSFPFPQGAFLG